MGISESSEADGARKSPLTEYGLGDARCYKARVEGAAAAKGRAGPKQASQEEHENRNPEWSLEDSVRVERH